MAKASREYLQGLVTSKVAVAQVVGEILAADMTNQTWKLIGNINDRLNKLISAEITRLGIDD